MKRQGQVFHYHIDPDILVLWPDPYGSNSPARFITSPRAAMGARLPGVWSELQGQIYLGPKAFIDKMQTLVDKKPSLTEIPRAQRRAAKRALAEFAGAHERNEAIALAYLSGQHTMSAIAAYFGVHYTTVSRLVKAYEVDQKP